jgi:methyltransferase
VWPSNDRATLSNDLSCCEPLPLEYIAGALRGRFEVKIHDLRLDGSLEELDRIYRPDVIGLAIPYTSIIKASLQTALAIKNIWPDVPLIVGGHHPTVSDMWLDRFPADYIIKGEGGDAFLNLVTELEKEMGSYKRPSVPKIIKAEPMNDLNAIARPDRTLLRHNSSKYFHSIYRPVSLMRFSAGCPYHCSFCVLWKLTDRQYFTKTIPSILAELSEIEVDNIYITDDEAFIQSKRMHELADVLQQTGVKKKYHMYLRSDTALKDRKVIEKWAEIGLDSVLVGAESFKQEDLIEYDKKTTISQTAEAVQFFHSLGIKVRANFIIKPEYDNTDFALLSETVRRLNIDMPSYAVMTPLPGTDLHDQTLTTIQWDNPDLYDCYHTLFSTKLPLEKFYEVFADLVAGTAYSDSRKRIGESTPMFYFTNNDAFSKMLSSLKNGALLHQE